MDEQKRMISASVLSISEQQSNSIYMSIEMRMFSTKPNRNKEAVRERFINEIASNQEKYICIPLCADVTKLSGKDYRGLGHMLRNGEFYSQIIGGFVSFKRVEDEYGISLIGEARVMKRNKKVCQALSELYEKGDLNFSFEILASEVEEENGIVYIDASEGNALIGMAVVSIPAYPEAKALALVAEVDSSIAFENAQIAEIDFETIRGWIWEAASKLVGEENAWYLRFEKIGVDFAVFYLVNTGQTYKMEYVVRDDTFVITDMYEVDYQRKVSEEQMTLEQTLERVSELEQKLEQVEKEKASYEAEKNALVEERDNLITLKSEVEAQKNEIESQKNEIASQLEIANATIKELEPFKAQVELIEAAKKEEEARMKEEELQKKKEKAKAFAEKSKLDSTNEVIANAIENADFEALIAEAEKVEKIIDAFNAPLFTSAFTDMVTKGNSAFGGIFDSVKKN